MSAALLTRPKYLAFVLSAMLCGATVTSVHAQTQNADASIHYDVPAGSLVDALRRFAQQSGVAISLEANRLAGRNTQGLRGHYSVDDGFERLLKGSGYKVSRTESGYVLVPAPDEAVLRPVKVVAGAESEGSAANAYRSSTAKAGVLGAMKLKDTPYSIEVYSRELMDNLQARSLAELTKYDASVGLMPNNLATENNSLVVRGLTPDGGTGNKIDGLNVQLSAKDLPVEHLERIELLKGAGGFLYGFGAPGGIFNHVLKRAGDEPVKSLSVQFMDSGLALLHGDVGGRIGDDNRFGYRVNIVHEAGDTYIDGGESKRTSGSVALDWRITPQLVWRADALIGKHIREGGYFGVIPNATGLTTGGVAAPLKPIDGDERLVPKFSRYGSRIDTYATDVSWQFAPEWNLALAYRFSDNGREFAMPNIYADAQGGYSMRFWNYSNGFESEQLQGMLSGKFNTGFVEHNIVTGASKTETKSFYSEDQYLIYTIAPAGNLTNPVDFGNPFGYYVDFDDADTNFARVHRREIFISDTMHFGESWDVILGLRHGNLENKIGDYDESAVTPTVAVTFRPVQALSLYASYVEALEEGNIAPGDAANAFEVFDPMESKQYEVGTKAEGDSWSASAALFRLERGLTYTTASNVFTQDGEARYQGVELSSKLRPTPQWLVIASAMWLDATNEKTSGGSLDGEPIQGVAGEQFSLYGEYTVAGWPLTLSGGARYVGKRPIDTLDQFHVGSVTLFDLGARYETRLGGNAATVRLNIENLADEAYWITQPGSRSLQQGAPRTVKLGAQVHF